LSQFYNTMFSRQNHDDHFITELENNSDTMSIETLSDSLDFLANTHLDLTFASNNLNGLKNNLKFTFFKGYKKWRT